MHVQNVYNESGGKMMLANVVPCVHKAQGFELESPLHRSQCHFGIDFTCRPSRQLQGSDISPKAIEMSSAPFWHEWGEHSLTSHPLLTCMHIGVGNRGAPGAGPPRFSALQ